MGETVRGQQQMRKSFDERVTSGPLKQITCKRVQPSVSLERERDIFNSLPCSLVIRHRAICSRKFLSSTAFATRPLLVSAFTIVRGMIIL